MHSGSSFPVLTVVFLSLVVVRTWAGSCECAGFLKYNRENDHRFIVVDSRKRITPSQFDLQEVDCSSPKANEACKEFCYQEYFRITNGGDLNTIVEDQEHREVGQILCDYLQRDVFGDRVAVYSKACNNNYVYTGLESRQQLCCAEDIYFECPSEVLD